MCNCGITGSSSVPFSAKHTPQTTTPEDCPYSLEQLQTWRSLLLCVRQLGIKEQFNLTEAKLNSYTGIVISAINYSWNLCYFQKQLDQIAQTMLLIINSEACQSES